MKATALKTSWCEGFEKDKTYEVLQLETYAIRIKRPGRSSRVVARKDFEITQEPHDPDELINNL